MKTPWVGSILAYDKSGIISLVASLNFNNLSLVAIDSLVILGVDDTKGVDDVDWFNTGDIPALTVAVDESIDGTTEVCTTEWGTTTPGANPTAADELDLMGFANASVSTCWDHSVAE